MSLEKPASSGTYRVDGMLVRELHVPTIEKLADDGVLSCADADLLKAELERLPLDMVEDRKTTSGDRFDWQRLLGKDGLRQWVSQTINRRDVGA